MPKHFTVEALAERWNVTRPTVIKQIHAGRLRGINLGSDKKALWRVPEAAVLEFENEQSSHRDVIAMPMADRY